MDSRRFDAIARSAALPATRRSALGALISGGILGAFGLGQAEPTPVAAQGQGGLCVLDFVATVRQGPSTSRPLVAGGAPGELRGYLRFFLSRSGNLQDADLLLDDGSSLPVVGQATGYGFQARIDIGQGRALVAVGVGEQDVTRCLGRLDGPATGPQVGDLGEWHATAGVQNLPSGSDESGASSGTRGGENGSRPAGASTGGGSQPNGGSQSNAGGASGGGSTGGSRSGGSGRACPQGQTRCGDACADLQTDPVNCGACGERCAVNNCTGGVCGEAGASLQNCAPPFGVCGATCVDLSSDARNCGRCGTACPAGEECVDGSCQPAGFSPSGGSSTSAQSAQTCPSGQTHCGDTCVDVQTDTTHCGRCDHPCASELGAGSCIDGVCTCRSDTTRCDNVCVNTDRDPFNCGRCGTQCAGDQECVGGVCNAGESACPQGQTRCSGGCVDVQTDPANCGACGNACPAGETCTGGKCTQGATTACPERQVRCGGACVEALPNFGSDGISCPGGGAPPTECPAGRVLCNGACFPEGACQPAECQPGWGYCYGVCRDFQNESGYCGSCSNACTGGTFCSAGTCVSCPEGQTLCSAGCVDTKTDLNNCGFCGNLCGTQCIDGQCTGVGPAPGCAPGATRCGDVCVDLTRDVNNCGQCGKKCDADSYCAPSGDCYLTEAHCQTTYGKHSCGTYCTSFESRDACGGCGLVCPGDDYCKDGLCYTPDIGGHPNPGHPPNDLGTRTLPPDQQTLAPADQQTLAPADVTTCAPGLVACGGVCVDVASDPLHCGACGTACSSGEACTDGNCAPGTTTGCPEGQVLCSDTCRNELPTADGGIVCSGGGAPPAACPPGQALCNGACYPEGACQPVECPPGWGYCYGICKDFQTDPGYCGSCSNACPGGICSSGTCVECAAGLTPCGAACVDTKTDLGNCGFCGNACGTQCLDGQCTGVGPAPTLTCPAGQTLCGDACVDLTTDSANCGQCGVVCSSPTHCAPTGSGNPPGICFIPAEVCNAQGKSTCGEYCADTETDPNNCGGCYSRCGAGSECQGGLCTVPSASSAATLAGDQPVTISCPEEQVDCGGVCTDLSVDPLNCGGCFTACAADATCQSGQCSTLTAVDDTASLVGDESASSCLEGQVDCGGYCADVFSDPYNCGGCDVICGPGITCDFGVCSEDTANAPAEDQAATAPDDGGTTCTATGDACDPATPDACCSGACNDDGTCA